MTGARCAYLNGEGGKVTIESGEYTTQWASAPAVYVGTKGGKVVIEGGIFKAQYGEYDPVTNKYLLNLKDDLLKGTNKKATDFIEVRGGEFYNFDPSKSESENPQVSFLAEGYSVTSRNDGKNTIYTVKKDD